MGDSSFFAVPIRPAAECEQLVVHRFPGGWLALASLTDVRRLEPKVPDDSLWQRIRRRFLDADSRSIPVPPVSVPSGAYLILKAIPASLQQRDTDWKTRKVLYSSKPAPRSAATVANSDSITGFRSGFRSCGLGSLSRCFR
jgi:hypothetical protein